MPQSSASRATIAMPRPLSPAVGLADDRVRRAHPAFGTTQVRQLGLDHQAFARPAQPQPDRVGIAGAGVGHRVAHESDATSAAASAAGSEPIELPHELPRGARGAHIGPQVNLQGLFEGFRHDGELPHRGPLNHPSGGALALSFVVCASLRAARRPERDGGLRGGGNEAEALLQVQAGSITIVAVVAHRKVLPGLEQEVLARAC